MDYAVHLAMMNYGQQGYWNYQFRFTTEEHADTFLRTFYIFLGNIGRLSNLPNQVIFQITRIFFNLLACLSIYRLISRIYRSRLQGYLAFTLAGLGAGLGWLQLLTGWAPDPMISSIDVWLIDAYMIFSLALFPHFSVILAAMALALTAFLDQLKNPHWKNLIIIAGCAIFVQIINPIAFVLVDIAMVGAYLFWCWKQEKLQIARLADLLILAIIQIPILIYSVVFLTRDPAWAIFTQQNSTQSPPPIYYLLGFGLFWPFSIIGAIQAIQKRSYRLGWAVVWVVAAFALAYLPVAIQRRFLLGVTIPLAVLATPPLTKFSLWMHQKTHLNKGTGAFLITALTSMTTLVVFFGYCMQTIYRPASMFEPAALFEATDWLAAQGNQHEIVLAAKPTAEIVGIRTPLRLYYGHSMETLYFEEKAEQVEAFYTGLQPATWLNDNQIDWVILGPYESVWREIPFDYPNLKIAYKNDLVTIYRVSQP
jgi:hypothetical protein